MKDETRFACWDCETEFKPTQVRRVIVDDDKVLTSICNKCYTKRNDKKKQRI